MRRPNTGTSNGRSSASDPITSQVFLQDLARNHQTGVDRRYAAAVIQQQRLRLQQAQATTCATLHTTADGRCRESITLLWIRCHRCTTDSGLQKRSPFLPVAGLACESDTRGVQQRSRRSSSVDAHSTAAHDRWSVQSASAAPDPSCAAAGRSPTEQIIVENVSSSRRCAVRRAR